MKFVLRALRHTVLGGLLFWIPSVILHLLRGYRFSGIDALALLVLLPLITIWTILGAPRDHRLGFALFAILGVWLLGPLMMAISGVTSGGGFFNKPGGFHFVLVGTIFFPFYAFIMSTYDGTLGPLLLTTFLLPLLVLLSNRQTKKSAISDPSVH